MSGNGWFVTLQRGLVRLQVSDDTFEMTSGLREGTTYQQGAETQCFALQTEGEICSSVLIPMKGNEISIIDPTARTHENRDDH